MATPVFCCGFECGILPASGGGAQHWTYTGTNGAMTVGTSVVRSGARAMRVNAAAQAGISPAGVSAQARNVGRVYVRFVVLPDLDVAIVFTGTTDGPRVVFKLSDSKIYAGVGSTLGATGVTVTTDVWYRIDFDFNINTGGSDTCDVQVDGSACGQATATGLSATSTVSLGSTNASSTVNAYFDDFLLSHTAADYPLGAGKVEHFVPTSDGTHNIAGTGDFQRGSTGTDILNSTTDAWLLVDDVPLPSGTVDQPDCWRAVAPANPTTDYIESVFGPASGISTPTAGPRAVEVVLVHHQIATQAGQMVVRLNDNGTTDVIFDTGASPGVVTYRYARKHYADPPSAASAWAIGGGGDGDFTDLRVRFFGPDAAPDQCLDAVMIEAEFLAGSDQDVTGAHISSGEAVNAPSVAYAVALATIASTLVLTAPTVTVGDVSLTASTIASTAAVNEPSVAHVVDLPTIASTAVVNEPTASYVVLAPTIASSATLTAPDVTHVVELSTIASAAQLFAPALGEAPLEPPAIASTLTLFAPTVAVGDVSLDMPTITAGTALTAPEVAHAVSLPTIASTAAVFAPETSAQVDLPTIAAGTQLFAPVVGAGLSLPTIDSTVVLFAPTVTAGDVAVSLPTIASTATLTAPTVAAGDVTLSLPTIASSAVLTPPSVEVGDVAIVTATIAAGTQLFAPTVAGDGVIALPTIASSAIVSAPAVAHVVEPQAIASTTTLFAPSLAVGDVTLSLSTIAPSVALFTPTVVGGLGLTRGGTDSTWSSTGRSTGWSGRDRGVIWRKT